MKPASKPLIGLTCRFDENNDSYYLPADYSRAVAAAGGIPVEVPLIPEAAGELAASLDGIVLCGSASDVDPARYGQPRRPEVKTIHPDLDETASRLLEHAFREKKPVVAICYGVQFLNVFLDGTLIQHIPQGVPAALEHHDSGTRHAVRISPGSRLAEWAGGEMEIGVNSTHHQSIEKLGRKLRVVGRTSDSIIEAVEGNDPDHFLMGVQWHPERIWKEEQVSRRIFSELVHASTEYCNRFRHGFAKIVEIPAAEPL